MKRIIALLLVVVFMLTALLACNSDETEETSSDTGSDTQASQSATQAPSGTTTETDTYGQNMLVSAVPVDDLDFGGEELVILTRNDDKVLMEWGRENLEGDELNDAILTRNALVASDLGLTITLEALYADDAASEYTKLMAADVNQGYHNYDIVSHFAYFAVTADNKSFNANLLNKDIFPYFDFSLPCWNQAIYKNGTVNGQNFLCAGDMNLSLWNFSMIFWQNINLYEELRTPEQPANIQDLVLEGGWTLDVLYEWSTIHNDTAKNGDCGDQYGYSIQKGDWSTNPNDVIPYAWDLELMTIDNEGRHQFNMIDNEKAENAVYMMQLMKDAVGNAFNHHVIGGGAGCNKSEFTEGNVVFKNDVIYWTDAGNVQLREMEDTYALLPWPKYEAKQEGYATTSQDCYNLMTVIDHSRNEQFPLKGEEISAYLQYSTEYSYTNVRAYYHERIIKPKTLALREEVAEKSMKIFDMIISNIEFEYWTLYSSILGDTMHIFRGAIRDGKTLEDNYLLKEATYLQKLKDADIFFGLIEADE